MRKTKPAAAARSRKIEVPRDPDAGRFSERDVTPPRHHAVEGVDARVRGSLEPESPIARALQEHPPKGKGQLDVGTGGDAARPGKTGIGPTSIPPRRSYRQA
ncbi:MAG: hypothetical protein HYV96_05645 [Opitutae bacterium]|nr:hypothetical protein [Opitutae bacterium]